MGRPAKPQHLKLIAGNPGKRAVNKSEPKPTGTPVMPASLSPAARPIWTRLIHSMPPGVFAVTDEHLLAAYCEQVVANQTAVAAISQDGMVCTGSQGQQVPSPWIRIMNESARLIHALGPHLGLTPVARQQLNTAKDEDGANPFLI
jgi:P27 family predicted phage terminase small subunit